MGWEELLHGWSVRRVEPAVPEDPPDAHRAVEEAVLDAGIGDFLARAGRSGEPLTVLLNDPDRFTDSRTALEVVESVAQARGLDLPMRVLYATGSHVLDGERKKAHEERSLPQTWLGSASKEWHDARNPDTVLPVGDVELHRWVVESERILVVGSMESHYFAGVTGAHKTLTVGVMSYASIQSNHHHAMSTRARGLVLEKNPVFEPIAALVRALAARREVFAINEVLVNQRVVACTAGAVLESLDAGLPQVRRVFGRRLSEPAHLIVARVAPPLDRSLYQADKGIKNVEAAVHDGGVLLLEAACPDGIGLDHFVGFMESAPTHDVAIQLVEKQGYRLGDHKAVRLRSLTDRRGVRLGIVTSGLTGEEARRAGLERFSSRESAYRWAVAHLDEKRRTAVIVEDAGNMTLAV